MVGRTSTPITVVNANIPVLSIDAGGLFVSATGTLSVEGTAVGDVMKITPASGFPTQVRGLGGPNSLVIIDDGDAIANEVYARDFSTLTGSAGVDVVSVSPSGSSLTVTGGVETLNLNGLLSDVVLGVGDDTITINSISGSMAYRLDGGTGLNRVTFGDLDINHRIRNVEFVIAGAGNDGIRVETEADVFGGAGTDSITGSTGKDTLNGGAGSDTLAGGGGQDLFRGTASELSGDTITDLAVNESILVVDGITGAMTALLVGNRLLIDPDGMSGAAPMVEVNLDNAPAGRVGISGQTITLHADMTPPSVTIAASAPLVAGQPSALTFTFSEAVQGFSLADVTVVNGSLSSLTRVNAKTYAATFVPAGAGSAGLLVAAGSYEDMTNFAGAGASLVVDVSPPPPVLTQTGSAAADRVIGAAWTETLFGLDGHDTISAGEGQDTIWGGAGGDALTGDLGDDVLWGEAGSDTIDGGWGDDLLSGATEKDRLYGGLGNDTLWGGAGSDTLRGDDGKDVFVFDTKPNKSTNRDVIVDFAVKDDSIWLDNVIFAKLGKLGTEAKPALLKKDFFTIGSKAKDKNDYVIYDKAKGVLLYDADGSGKGKAVEFATLSKGLAMTYKDFFVI
ncbi:Ca2+-binding RTX toxin-like protein [Microvirga lupini]|uniref:Ca2+-binding RTX toxin-like protein n=1 Tax=Microvirga lupini TaxID=420324 RepID=A0A7W4VLE8_9HYPH|nr:Ig-like domain-containing protein [Microvirga lupini]MBB3018991.1 Ca2+-binding RTX toxin-like protein [Microvirga lupini]